jgi:hypothetical protein
VHPETGRTALFVSPGYTIGIEGMADAEAQPLLMELFRHQVREDFRLPPPLAAGHAGDVGQPLRGACGNRRLRRPRAAAAPHHHQLESRGRSERAGVVERRARRRPI